ncbi:MAG: hypothetical protein AAFQ63_16665 [Cyanobacteria bacterium J06621_11]
MSRSGWLLREAIGSSVRTILGWEVNECAIATRCNGVEIEKT